jgi:PAS domain S-box-containing protein
MDLPGTPTHEGHTHVDESTWVLLDHLGLAVGSSDPATGRIVRGTRRLADLLGYTVEELQQLSILDLTHPEDRSETAQGLARLAEGRSTQYRLQKRYLRRDGSVLWVLVNVSVLQGGPEPHQVIGVVEDITERHQAELDRARLLESERLARAVAERADRAKDDFLATLSHELRTPLNSMLGWAQILQRSTTDAQLMRGLQVIERNVRMQSQLIDDLMDMSRILSGKVRLCLEAVELGPIVEAAIETLRPSADVKGVSVRAVGVVDVAGVVRGDATRLQQVVCNLLSNAIKFTPAHGSIEVRIDASDLERRIVVADTGCGIHPRFLPHVFERFRQADASSTRRQSGLGLGLAIVRHLVEMHGGRVEAHSAGDGRGATFIVGLPVIEPIAESAEVRAGRRMVRQPSGLDGVRVLVVDDDPDARELAEHVLSVAGAAVTTSGSVSAALDAISGRQFDVLLSDISMPHADGYDLIAEVRSIWHREQLPAVALTAFARGEDRARALASGYDAHLAKPVDSRVLVETIATLARRRDIDRAP